ncbi:carboxypeptidase-like regulatory domain-containing protein [Terriglobus albidus]|uniref:carboxypeptidase-like regulatory domain-containing protein n=1 Tax=Terriglobus albidus TaxID=1592106 RepID=UPI0021E0C7FB|nr:carboxypeptidase-like regulatory domain-containing protein [Terriglobus albidus]
MIAHLFRLRALVAIFVLLLHVSALRAQTNYGGVRGLATDPTGAVISGAIVNLTDEGTRISRTAVTTSAGEYTFTAVDPGSYAVTIVAPGFTKLTQTHVSVTIGVTTTVDMAMKAGSADQMVEVTADIPMIDTASASNGQTFDQQKLQTLPNMGRNPFLFAKLDNNVTFTGDPRFVRFQDQSGSSQLSIAGGPTGTNNYLLDGIPITDSTNRAVIIPSLEATGEMKIQANTFDAEMGRTGGGVFNTSLRSGTNALHGTLQGLTRQTNWTANSWQYNRTPYVVNGVNLSPQTPRGASEWYSYVGAIGGPVRIPWLYNGKDRTFFWIAEEGYRQRSPLTSGNSGGKFPTALERMGDFSQSGITLYDPYAAPTGANRTVVIPNAKIPSSYLSPAGLKIAAAMPLPTTTPAIFGGNNTFGTDTLGDRADEFSAKLDHQVTRWWSAAVSYLHYGSKEPSGNAYQIPYSTSTLLYRKVDAINVNSTLQLSPTMIGTIGWGFNRFPNQTNRIHTGYDQTQLFPAAYVGLLTSKTFPTITTSGGTTAVLGGSDSGPSNYFSRSVVAGISKAYGKHNFKTGYVFRSISNSIWSTGSGGGSFTFTGGYTNSTNTPTTATGRAGSDIADLLMGLPNAASLTVSPGKFQFNTHYHALYFQDDFRVSQRLTLNMGLRYEIEQGFHEVANKLTVGLDPLATYNYGSLTNLRGGVSYAGVSGYKSYTGNYSPAKLAPRVGFAYGVLPKMTLRAGFGVFYAPSSFSPSTTYSPGFAATGSYSGPSGVAALPAGSHPLDAPQNLYSAGALTPSGSSLGYSAGIGGSLSFIDPLRRSPLVYQYSTDLQYELPMGFALKVGYVGAHGRNLSNSFNYNQLSSAARAAAGFPYVAGPSTGVATSPVAPSSANAVGTAGSYNAACTNCLAATVTNPYYSAGGNGILNRTTITRAQALRPFAQFTDITYASSLGGTIYNSLALKLQKSFNKGLTMMATYTWASSWDNLWAASSSLTSSGAGPQDTGNLAMEWARSTTGTPRRATINGTYELPFGRGRQYLSNTNRILDALIGGWNYNHVMILQSGSPLAVTQTSSSTDAGYGAQRPSFAPGATVQSVCSGGTLLQRLHASDFMTTGAYAYGNVPRTLPCLGPGYFNNDISVNKKFHVSERVTAEFRAEALNAFNTVQLAAPASSSITSGSFGTITSQIGFNRLVQMGGRIQF